MAFMRCFGVRFITQNPICVQLMPNYMSDFPMYILNNRPCVAGAVLHTPSSLINSFIKRLMICGNILLSIQPGC